MARQRKSAKGDRQVYTMVVVLANNAGAGMTAVPASAHPVSRTIEIRGDQALMELHDAIRAAFGLPIDSTPEFHFPRGRHRSEEGADEARMWGRG